ELIAIQKLSANRSGPATSILRWTWPKTISAEGATAPPALVTLTARAKTWGRANEMASTRHARRNRNGLEILSGRNTTVAKREATKTTSSQPLAICCFIGLPPYHLLSPS